MGWKDDLARSIKAQFPHAKIESITRPSRAQMEHERKETYKRSEERKWLEGEYGRYDKSRPKHHPRVILGTKKAEKKTKGLVHRVYVRPWVIEGQLYNPTLDVLHDMVNPKRIPKTMGRTASGHVRWVLLEEPEKFGITLEGHGLKSAKVRYRVQGITRKTGSGELLNENIAGVMIQHGHPDAVAAMRRSGALQTRRDENGNACEYFVSSSRRNQAETIKKYNRLQIEARDKGWGGTMSRAQGRRSVWLVAHGGNDMGV